MSSLWDRKNERFFCEGENLLCRISKKLEEKQRVCYRPWSLNKKFSCAKKVMHRSYIIWDCYHEHYLLYDIL